MSEKELCSNNMTNIYEVFECFNERFLKNKQSIFRIDSGEILNIDSVKYLIDNFVNRGIEGKRSFIDKIKLQLIGNEDFKPIYSGSGENHELIQKQAIEVLAHVYWLWRLVPSNALKETTLAGIQEIMSLNNELSHVNYGNNPFLNDLKGIASTGQSYNQNKPFEFAFFIKYLSQLFDINELSEINILNSIGREITIITVATLDKEDSLQLLGKAETETRSILLFNALLHFFQKNNYEAILSNGHKELIVETFKDLICENDNEVFEPMIDWKLKCIKERLDDNNNKEEFSFYSPQVMRLWKQQELNIFKNIIYHGAPGTGKTYELKEEIKEYLELYENGESEFIQFHGSYYYEDFIGGLKPNTKSNNGLSLEFRNGIFKELCRKASRYEIAYHKKSEVDNSLPKILNMNTQLDKDIELDLDEHNKIMIKKKIPILSQFPPYFILIDEINRADLSKVFGELLFAIEDDYRGFEHRFKLATAQMENKDTAVYWNNEEAFFFVPHNLYLRGTMNDIDRSVDSIDFAFRRRFKWVQKNYEVNKIEEILKDKNIEVENLNEYNISCNKLNKEILSIPIADRSYQIGHAIFANITKYLKSKKVTKESKEKLFDNHIEPIVYNYLKMDYGNEGSDIKQFREVFVK